LPSPRSGSATKYLPSPRAAMPQMTMEWLNIHQCESSATRRACHVSLEEADKLGREGAELARKNSFETLAKIAIKETPEADKMYRQLAKGADTPS
jgi:hypothetical protein